MNRIDAISILDNMVERIMGGQREIEFFFSHREALKVAIKDLKFASAQEELHKQFDETLRNFTGADWKAMNDFTNR